MENVDKICPICRKHSITLPNGVYPVCYDKVKTQADQNTTEWGKIENHGIDAIIVLAKYILDEIEDEVFCEYYCFCFLDGMPIEEVRRIDSVPVQNWKDKIKRIREERTGYLERLFVPDAQVTQQISKLHEKAGRVFKETEELRDTINTTLKQTLKIQEEALVQQKESYQSTLASKAELLKDREDKIQSLLSEIEQNKAVWENEKKDLLLKLEEKKTAVKEQEKKEAAFIE